MQTIFELYIWSFVVISYFVLMNIFLVRARFRSKVDEFVPQIQDVNFRIVPQLIFELCIWSFVVISYVLMNIFLVRAPVCSKVDEFVPQIQHVNLRIVPQLIVGCASGASWSFRTLFS